MHEWNTPQWHTETMVPSLVYALDNVPTIPAAASVRFVSMRSKVGETHGASAYSCAQRERARAQAAMPTNKCHSVSMYG